LTAQFLSCHNNKITSSSFPSLSKLGGSWQIIMARAFNVVQLVPYRLSAKKEPARPNKCTNFAVLVRNFKLRWRLMTMQSYLPPVHGMILKIIFFKNVF
jgi:hypothetical protein